MSKSGESLHQNIDITTETLRCLGFINIRDEMQLLFASWIRIKSSFREKETPPRLISQTNVKDASDESASGGRGRNPTAFSGGTRHGKVKREAEKLERKGGKKTEGKEHPFLSSAVRLVRSKRKYGH